MQSLTSQMFQNNLAFELDGTVAVGIDVVEALTQFVGVLVAHRSGSAGAVPVRGPVGAPRGRLASAQRLPPCNLH